MSYLLFDMALGLVLIASGGYVVFIVSQKKWVAGVSFWVLAAGFVCHSLFLGLRYVALETLPVLDFKSALSFFSWSIIAAYLALYARFRLRVLGSFAAPLAAVFMILSSAMPWTQGPVKPVFKSLWLTAHAGSMFLGNGLLAVMFLSAVMYLIQERQIKKKLLGSFFKRLPSLATLDSINRQSLVYGFPFLTLGMITGAVYAQNALGSYWRWDPKEVWSLITWLLYAALLHERLVAGWRGRRAAIGSIVCFCALVFTFVGGSLWLGGYHSFRSLGAP
ncbi:MAG: c-type cytochrome biogenesis protein CcsB [Deltaproteobacteria bacterium]|nr:MAG: c-type cytochrome biogenesis protein CcsB [Deltaproteobacteria bacterium]